MIQFLHEHTGTGKAFSAGLDLKDWDAGERPAAEAYHWDPVASLQRFSGPVIAAVNGLPVTGGVELVLACDMILASDQAWFADTHARALAQEMLKARPEDLARYKRLLDEESRLPTPEALQREREASQALSETVSAQDLLQRLARLRQDPTR